MKYLVLATAAGLALGCVSIAQAQPTDNSEAGLNRRSVVGSDYWADVHRTCHARSSGPAHRLCDAGHSPNSLF